MNKQVTIQTLDGFSRSSDADVATLGTAVSNNMTDNTNYPDPPVPPKVLKEGVDKLLALMAEARDGSKKVIAEKNKQRHEVIQMLRLLARYVEVACKNDMATFKTSGFDPKSTAKPATQSLSESIRGIDHGPNSGQISVSVRRDPEAGSYELRYAPLTGGTPGTWTTEPLINVRTPVVLSGLTPGTTYSFQARALTQDGYTDWSDPVTFICT